MKTNISKRLIPGPQMYKVTTSTKSNNTLDDNDTLDNQNTGVDKNTLDNQNTVVDNNTLDNTQSMDNTVDNNTLDNTLDNTQDINKLPKVCKTSVVKTTICKIKPKQLMPGKPDITQHAQLSREQLDSLYLSGLINNRSSLINANIKQSTPIIPDLYGQLNNGNGNLCNGNNGNLCNGCNIVSDTSNSSGSDISNSNGVVRIPISCIKKYKQSAPGVPIIN